jgi:hypothetical protein
MNLRNPNALVGGGSALIGGQIVLNVAKALGYDLSPGWSLGLGAALTSAVLFVGREGFAGVWEGLKHGFGKQTPKAGP